MWISWNGADVGLSWRSLTGAVSIAEEFDLGACEIEPLTSDSLVGKVFVPA